MVERMTGPNSSSALALSKEVGVVRRYVSARLSGSPAVQRLLEAMLKGDTETFGAQLGEFLLSSMSFHDPAGAKPERVYHAFVLGLLVSLAPTYEVRSNPEAGYGRVDVL